MLGRIAAASVGAIVTYLALIILNATAGDAAPKYGLAVFLGAVATVAWPWVFGLIAVRRIRRRRDKAISREVDRRVSERDRRP